MENHEEVQDKVTNLIVLKMFLIVSVMVQVYSIFLILLKLFLKSLLLCAIIVWNELCNHTIGLVLLLVPLSQRTSLCLIFPQDYMTSFFIEQSTDLKRILHKLLWMEDQSPLPQYTHGNSSFIFCSFLHMKFFCFYYTIAISIQKCCYFVLKKQRNKKSLFPLLPSPIPSDHVCLPQCLRSFPLSSEQRPDSSVGCC